MVLHPEGSLLEVARILDTAGVTYAIGGSIASGHHGEIRATNDIDVLVELGRRDVRALVDALGDAWHVDEGSMNRAIGDGSSFSILHLESLVKVDFFVATDARLDRLQLSRRVPVRLDVAADRAIWFSSPEDTVLRKLDGFRRSGGVLERQLRDVAGVLKACGNDLDFAYLRAAAASQALDDLLERSLEAAGLGGSRPLG